MSAGQALLQVRALSVDFGGRAVLDRVDVAVHRAEIVTLIGPNGSGKTTLVRAALGLVPPRAGTIARQPALRIGYVPQHVHVDATLPLSVRRFVALAPGVAAGDTARVLEQVGAQALAGSPMSALSGGEMRRVLLARALARRPDLLILDEPTAGVDVGGQADLYRLIESLRQRHRCGVLLVSHDLHLVMASTDRVSDAVRQPRPRAACDVRTPPRSRSRSARRRKRRAACQRQHHAIRPWMISCGVPRSAASASR
jgi:zinc transport system ATP-binding protein